MFFLSRSVTFDKKNNGRNYLSSGGAQVGGFLVGVDVKPSNIALRMTTKIIESILGQLGRQACIGSSLEQTTDKTIHSLQLYIHSSYAKAHFPHTISTTQSPFTSPAGLGPPQQVPHGGSAHTQGGCAARLWRARGSICGACLAARGANSATLLRRVGSAGGPGTCLKCPNTTSPATIARFCFP